MKKLQDLFYKLDGYKTYLVAIVTAILNLLVAMNVISVTHLDQINMMLVALGGAALRSGVKKVE